MSDEAIQKALGELFAANRATQANFDEIRQQFPVQPENLANAIPSFEELEEGGLVLPEPPEESEPGEVLEIGEDGKPKWGKPTSGAEITGNAVFEWGGAGNAGSGRTVEHGLGQVPGMVNIIATNGAPAPGMLWPLVFYVATLTKTHFNFWPYKLPEGGAPGVKTNYRILWEVSP